MIRFTCSGCKLPVCAPDDCAGRTTKCRQCGNAITVPDAATAEPPSIPEAIPVVEPYRPEPNALPTLPTALPAPKTADDGPMTSCSACGRAIAKLAATCPQCGGPNTWVHPEIAKFFRSIRRFEFPSSFQFKYEKLVLVGVDPLAHRDAQSLASLASSFGVIAPLNLHGMATMLSVRAGQTWLQNWANKKVKAFRIDFSSSPPNWSSTDDSYWDDVMDFFGV
jgi:hypothetical protein